MGNRDDIAELVRHERADTLPIYLFTYEGLSGPRSEVVCAACLSKPEVSALYAYDLCQAADLKRDGERSIWHRPGELDALTKYELVCSCCGQVVESEQSDDDYFAPKPRPEMRGTCASFGCARACAERGNGSENLCENCAHDRLHELHDALSDILEAPESRLLPEHRAAALSAMGLEDDGSPHDCGDHDCIKRRVPDAECEVAEAAQAPIDRLSEFGRRALASLQRCAPQATWEYEAGKPRLIESLILDARALDLLPEARR